MKVPDVTSFIRAISHYDPLTATCHGMALGSTFTAPLRSTNIGPLPARAERKSFIDCFIVNDIELIVDRVSNGSHSSFGYGLGLIKRDRHFLVPIACRPSCGGQCVGWVERSDTHQFFRLATIDGFRCALPILRISRSTPPPLASALPTLPAPSAVTSATRRNVCRARCRWHSPLPPSRGPAALRRRP